MELRVDDKVAVVTGTSRGIGRAIAQFLVDAGARVMLVARKEEELRIAVKELGDASDYRTANVGEPAAAEATIAATIARFGSVDILVNNAATNPYHGPTIDADLARYDKTIQVNLRGPFVWTQQAWRQCMRERGGSVVNVVSCAAFVHNGALGVYGMTKAGLVHHTKQLASELGPGVRVNAVSPAFVPTSMTRVVWEREGGVDDWAQTVPLKRAGTPEDVAAATLYFASSASSWITGQVLVLDGGMMLGVARG